MGTAVPWINRLAADLLDAEAELRAALRERTPNGIGSGTAPFDISTKSASRAGAKVTLTRNQARTLLRAAMPAPIMLSRRMRTPHARMNVAVEAFAARLLSLNDPIGTLPDAIAAALQLADELRAWTEAARWQQATHAAGKRWPRLSIREITQLQTTGMIQNTEETSVISQATAHSQTRTRRALADNRKAAAAQASMLAAEPAAEAVKLTPRRKRHAA